MRHLVQRFRVSERRACRLLDQQRSTQRYKPLPPDYELRLVKRMNQLAQEHPRWGYRMVCTLLRSEGWLVNRKRVERLWRLEGNRVPPRRSKASGRKAEGASTNAAWNLPAKYPHHIWSFDFMVTRTRGGGPIRILNVVDEYTRLAVGCRVARSIGTRDVIAELDLLFAQHGKPKIIRSDNGREFIAASLRSWLAERGVTLALIEKASPQQNCFVERFNGTMREEKLNGEDFDSVLEARVVLREWALNEYNNLRPHRGHGMMTPRRFADSWKAGRT